MDPLGLLLEVVALAAYPGGLFLAVMAWVTYRGAGMPPVRPRCSRAGGHRGCSRSPRRWHRCPGPRRHRCRHPAGRPRTWWRRCSCRRRRLARGSAALVATTLVLVGFGGTALVLLGLVATSFSSTDISGATGSAGAAARILAVIAVLVALPAGGQAAAAERVRRRRGQRSSPRRSRWCSRSLIPPAQQWPVGAALGRRAGRGGGRLRAAAAARASRDPKGAPARWFAGRVAVLDCRLGDGGHRGAALKPLCANADSINSGSRRGASMGRELARDFDAAVARVNAT